MTTERRVCDDDVRRRVTTDLGTTFLLEAGAGTGKTRVLVDRYVRCVLDARRGAPGDVRSVAAITFTEKAAGELRQRIREEFEQLAAAASGADESGAIQAALDGLDDAPISTIHGFAGRLLREFPVEAEVDPAFEQLDALGSDLERARLWEEWLSELAAGDAQGSPARRGLSRLLRAGVRLEWLRALAVGPKGVFGERYDLDPPTDLPEQPALALELERLADPLERLAQYCATACSSPADKGYGAALKLVDAGRALLKRPPGDVDQVAAALYALAGQGHSLGSRRREGQLESGARRQGGVAGAVPSRRRRGPRAARGVRRLSHGAGGRSRRFVLPLGGRYPGRPRTARLHGSAGPAARPAGARSRRPRGPPGSVPLPPRRRVPGHRPAAGRDRLLPVRTSARGRRLAPGRSRARQTLRGRRPQAVDLPVPARRHRHVRRGPPTRRRPARRRRRHGGDPPELPHDALCGPVGQQRLRRRVRRRSRGGASAGLRMGRAVPAAGRGPEGRRAPRRRLRRPRPARRTPPAAPKRGHSPRSCSRCAGPARSAGRSRTGTRRATKRSGARLAGATSLFSSEPRPDSRPTSRRFAKQASPIGWTAARRTSPGARSTTPCSACGPSTIRATGPPCTGRCTPRSSVSATTSSSCSGRPGAGSICSPRRLRSTPPSARRSRPCASCMSAGPSASRTSSRPS